MQPGAAVAAGESGRGRAVPEWVVFTCAGHWYGLPMEHMREILPPRPYTRLPGSVDAVCGLIGVRGQVITVVDVGAALGVDRSSATADYRIMLLERNARRIGLAVESVLGVVRQALSAVTDRVAGPGGEDLIGTGAFGGERFHALDVDRLLARVDL